MSSENLQPVTGLPTQDVPPGQETVVAPEPSTLDVESAAEAEPRRKVQLKPTLNPLDARPVPSLGSVEAVAPASSGPVSIPAAHDQEVEAEIAKAITGIAGDAVMSPPTEADASGGVPLPPPVESLDAAIEAAIEAAIGIAGPATSGVASAETPGGNIDALRQGQRLQGVVQSIHEDNVFVDLGMRYTCVVPRRQFEGGPTPNIGDPIEVVYDRVDEDEGLILANRPRGTSKVQGGDYSQVSMGDIVECVVTKTNKGGLEVTVSSLRAFIPASQVDLGYVADLEPFVGQKFRVKVTEVKPSKKKLVVSRRALLIEERAVAKKDLMEQLQPDQVRTGRVKTIKEYGAFIDLGGVDGFLPISQMSWVRIESPSEMLREGQEVEVKVLSIDREKDRISLGMRQLAPNPWKLAESKYPKGSKATGRVTKVEPFGAFVELEPGIEGLVHISELEHRRVKRVTEVLNVGDMAEVQILEVDPGKKRISLSVKALKAKPEAEEKPKDEDLAPGKGEVHQRKRTGPLKGGIGGSGGGGLFGNPRDFS